jgi:hypothetical protein
MRQEKVVIAFLIVIRQNPGIWRRDHHIAFVTWATSLR